MDADGETAAPLRVVDASGVARAPREHCLPVGVRPRQLSVRTLSSGSCSSSADGRPAHLAGCTTPLWASVSRTAVASASWSSGSRTPRLDLSPGGAHLLPAPRKPWRGQRRRDGLAGVPKRWSDALLEASVPAVNKDATSPMPSTGPTSRASPPGAGSRAAYNDPDASWGHRKGGGPGEKDDRFFGYYLQISPP